MGRFIQVDYKKLSTKRLLAHFKAERNKLISCNDAEHNQYLQKVKTELDSREHIEKK